jgi:hypothetical protein
MEVHDSDPAGRRHRRKHHELRCDETNACQLTKSILVVGARTPDLSTCGLNIDPLELLE